MCGAVDLDRRDDRRGARMQGFIGGAMIPTVFATAFIDLPALAHGPWSRR